MDIILIKNLALILTVIFYIYIIVVIIFIIMENRDTQSTFAWIFVFILLPVIGFIIYIFFGRNWRIHSRKKKAFYKNLQKELKTTLKPINNKEKAVVKKLQKGTMREYKKLIELLENFEESIFTQNNSLEILQNGQEKFPKLEEDLKNAKKYIHMEYFIWRDDELTKRIKNILLDRAWAGVKVRILIDPTGSFLFFLKSRRYIKDLRDAGVEIVPFINSMTHSKFTALNNINHNKIAIIDGKIAYTGGMNMGQEYIDGKPDFKSWRDTSIRIEGDAVIPLQSTFVYHWETSTNTSLFKKECFKTPKRASTNLPVQILTSGPDSDSSTIRQLFFLMITAAKKNVYIQSPYFIPDATIFEALRLSALSGIDTRLMITGVPDKKVAFWAAFSYFEELLKSGVKIYHYKAGFLHSKTICVDKKFCTIGTTNLDLRSFTTSHEINTVIYDTKTTKELEQDFMNDLEKCTEITLKKYENIKPITKFRNSLCRLLAPLL